MALPRIFESFRHALRGLWFVFRSESNFRFQILAGIIAGAFAAYFPLRSWEIILIILLVGLVLVMEILNTALEYFADLLKPRLHHYVFIIKDIMAGAVLLTALGALAIGTMIFLPHFIALLE